MSLTYIKKRSGPSTEPWGTPHTIVSLLETVEPICVDCVLHDKYEENQALIINFFGFKFFFSCTLLLNFQDES